MSKKVPYTSLVGDPSTNHRPLDLAFVADLKASIKAKDKETGKRRGLLENIKAVFTVRPGDDGVGEECWLVNDGLHRYTALEELRNSVDPEDIEAFENVVPNGKIEITEVEGTGKALRDTAVVSNTHRRDLDPYDRYLEAVRRSRLGEDQYEIASVLRMQQPRIAELLSFQKLIPEILEAWKNKQLYSHDLVQFVTLDDEAQEKAFKEFKAKVADAGGSKKEARKALKAEVATKGKKREYANTGKPSRQTLASYVPRIFVQSHAAKSAKERDFYNALAAAFKIMNGELAFDKLDPAKTYVTVKEASAASAAIAEAEAKAAAKAEKAAAKAAKKKATKKEKVEKAPKEKKAAKAPKAEKPEKPAKEKKAPKEKAPKAEKPAKEPKAPKEKKAPKEPKTAAPKTKKKSAK